MSATLDTVYLGLALPNPIVISACPFVEDLDMLRQLEGAGAAAAVFPSLFEEQIVHEQMQVNALYEHGAESFGEATSYFPDMETYNLGSEGYLRRLTAARQAVAMPLIGSLNGITTGGWVRYATRIEEAGVDALELNITGFMADPEISAADAERIYIDLVREVRSAVQIPLALKIGPYFSSLGSFAQRLVNLGVDGLVIFNRFVPPDIDLETLTVTPRLELSTSSENRMTLTWIALLRDKLNASIAAGMGIHTSDDVLKMILVGADVTMMASAVLRHGPQHITKVLEGVQTWLDEREYESVQQAKGSLSQQRCPDPLAYERVGYMRTLASWSTSVGGA